MDFVSVFVNRSVPTLYCEFPYTCERQLVDLKIKKTVKLLTSGGASVDTLKTSF